MKPEGRDRKVPGPLAGSNGSLFYFGGLVKILVLACLVVCGCGTNTVTGPVELSDATYASKTNPNDLERLPAPTMNVNPCYFIGPPAPGTGPSLDCLPPAEDNDCTTCAPKLLAPKFVPIAAR